jgi:hypothetical protein
MTYEVEFKSPGKSMPFQYREYTVRAQNVLEAEEKAFKRLKIDKSINNEWIKNAEVHQIVHSLQ